MMVTFVLTLLVALSYVALWPVLLSAFLRLLFALVTSGGVKVSVTKATLVWPRSIRIANIRIRDSILALVDAFVDVETLSIDSIEIAVPSVKSQVGCVQVDGVHVQVSQRQYPKTRRKSTQIVSSSNDFPASLSREKVLGIIESVLWDGEPTKGSASSAKARHAKSSKMINLAEWFIQRISVRIAKTEILYLQERQGLSVSISELYFVGSCCYEEKRLKLLKDKYSIIPSCVCGLSSLKIGVVERDKLADPKLLQDNASYLIQQWSLGIALRFLDEGTQKQVVVDVDLNSLAVRLNEYSLNQLLPLLSNLQYYFAHENVWRHRPEQPVFNHAPQWWHYAIEAVRNECLHYQCPTVSSRRLEERRDKRIRYLSIYRAKHVKWWECVFHNRKRVDDLLQEAEKELTLEEIAHFRSHFAFSNSRDKDAFLGKIGIIDGIVNNFLIAQSYERKDVSSGLQTILNVKCPKISLGISQASYWDSFEATTTLALCGLEIVTNGGDISMNCSGIRVSNDRVQMPLIKGARNGRKMLSVTTEKRDQSPQRLLVHLTELDIAISPDWMEQLMDVANILSCSARFFTRANCTPASLVQDTYSMNPAKPPCISSGLPIAVNIDRISCSLMNIETESTEMKMSENNLTISLESIVIEKTCSLKSTSTLRSQALLHRKKRKRFETVIACAESKLKIELDVSVFIQVKLDDNLKKIYKILDLPSIIVSMDSEDVALPKSLGSVGSRCGVTLQTLNIFMSEARLKVIAQLVDEILLRLSVKKETNIDHPGKVEPPCKITASGHSDSFSDFYLNVDTIAVNLLTDKRGQDGKPVMTIGVCNIMARYCKDSPKDLQVVKFGVGVIMAETYKSSSSYCILGPMQTSSRVDLAVRSSCGRRWARLRQKLQSEMILDYFPKWMTHQLHGTVYISANSTTAIMIHLANLDILADTSLYDPIIKYIFNLQDSFILKSGGNAETPKSIPNDDTVVEKRTSLVEVDITRLSVTLSHLHKEITCLVCSNTAASLYTVSGNGPEACTTTKLNIERISIEDLISDKEDEILLIYPLDTQANHGISLTNDAKGGDSMTVVQISKIRILLIQRFIGDVLFFVSRITSALPAKGDSKCEQEETSNDEEPEPIVKKPGKSSQFLSIQDVEVVLPIHEDNHSKFFKLLVSVKVQIGGEIDSTVDGVSQPSLELCLNKLSFGFLHTYLGFHDFIPETNILCYLESVGEKQNRLVMFCNVLTVNLSQLIYGHLMEFLSGNLADTSVFAETAEEKIVLKKKDDFMGLVYKYQEHLEFPKSDVPSLEVCISSSKWDISFQDSDSPIQYGVFTLNCPSFAYRVTSTGRTHICISCSNFCLKDMQTKHALKEILRSNTQAETTSQVDQKVSSLSFDFILLLQREGPMVIELKLCNTTISWPYLQNMGFITNILSVLQFNEYTDDTKPTKIAVPQLSKWFYFNLIAKETKIFVPLPLDLDDQKQQNGILAKTDTLQFRYGFGADGQTAMRCRAYNFEVGFKIRASIPNEPFLLPFNFVLDMNTSAPRFDEEVAKVKKALVVQRLQRWWRENHGCDDPTVKKNGSTSLQRTKSFTQITKRKAFILEHGIYPNEREKVSTKLSISLDKIILKACFSEVHLWNRLLSSLTKSEEKPDNDETESEGIPEPVKEIVFRPSVFAVDLKLNCISVVICDDRPRTYGNPDVVRLYAKTCTLLYEVDCQEEDTGAKTTADLKLALSAQYLDSSVSRYANIILPWEVEIQYKNSNDAYGGKNQSLWLNSEERLDIHISPHILLALGDAMTFSKMLTSEVSMEQAENMRKHSTGEGELVTESELAPQKYCLNNYSGVSLWYWSSPQTAAHRVNDKKRVILKVKPYLTEKAMHSKGSKSISGASLIQYECLNLQFEGNWSPMLHVNVSLVGKYKYMLQAPLHNIEVPVIVDIVLVGRTKVISVHSPYWVYNRSDRDLVFRLQQSLGYLNAPSSQMTASSSERDGVAKDVSSDFTIGPIETGSGFYLPITSSIKQKSVLFVRSADGLLESTAHNIHIVDVDSMDNQQQMIECKSAFEMVEYTPTPELSAPGQISDGQPGSSSTSQQVGSVEAIPLSDTSIPETSGEFEEIKMEDAGEEPEPSTPRTNVSRVSEGNQELHFPHSFFCNLQIIKVPPRQVHLPSYNIDAQGLAMSSSPIECELSFQPPLVIFNALPYDVEIYLVDMKEGYQTSNSGPDGIDRTASVGSTGSRIFSASKSFRAPANSETGVTLKPGTKADIYCDLQKKQKLSIRVKTAAQGMLKTSSPLVIHEGRLINDKKREQNLPKHAVLYPVIQTPDESNANQIAEIELTSAFLNEQGETPLSPGQDGASRYSTSNKQKIRVGIENIPTGIIGRKVTIYCPYWINNQTGRDLLFSENNSLPRFGKARRKDEIFVPGTANCNSELSSTENADGNMPMPVLFNTKQQRIFFRMAGERLSPYGPSVHIQRPGPSGHNPIPISESIIGRSNSEESHNLYHFAVDILPCPADSIYNKTKVISVKTAIVIENMSTFSIVYKQSGLNDPSTYCKVGSAKSVNHHWESIFNPLEITIRPTGSAWNWSSAFPLLGTGDLYFGLRLSHQDQEDVFLIIPVSITVSATHILVSFKDPSAEPPYRIQNDCKEISIRFKQVENKKAVEADEEVEVGESLGLETNPESSVMPGTSMNYAWDVPMWPHKLSVSLVKVDLLDETARTEYSIDELGDRKPITLSDIKRKGSRTFIPTPSFSMSMSMKKKDKSAPTRLEKKLKAVLAKDLANKVFVSVYADGPTRVLKFSDKKDSASIQSELSMLEMHARLRKLEDELVNNVNKKFANLMGHMKSRPVKIDLYGRNARYLDSYLKLSTSVVDHWKMQKTPGRLKLEAQQQAQLRSSKKRSSRQKKMTQDILVDEMKDSLQGDNSNAILSLGGELTVTVHSAKNLGGNPQTCHTYAEVDLDGQSYQTNLFLQSCDPVWDESFTFPHVRATNFLDLSIYKVRAQSCAPVRKSGASKTFLGSVRISLLESFTMESNDSIHYILGKQQGTDSVSGEIVISLSWRTNANSLMQIKVATLEEILAQRMEILAQLKPLSSEEWEERISNITKREALVHHLGYQTGELQVTVMEARNLHRKSSFQPLATLDFSIEGPLCNPFVVVKCQQSKEEKSFSTNVVNQSLEPLFDKSKRFKFEEVPLSASITFELYDKNAIGRADLLGSRTVYCSEISTSISTPFNPVYTWIRLSNSRKATHGVDKCPEIHVRMQWTPPHNSIKSVTSVNVTLSSIGIALISGLLGGELINTTLDSINVRQVQDEKETMFSGSIQKIQIDNQLPNSVQPVILRNQEKFLNISFCEIFTSKTGESNIRSIKDMKLDFGDLTLEVDDLFMDAVLKFAQALPTSDLYQDDNWNARQDCMLNFALPFGPPEIKDLSGNQGEEITFLDGLTHPTEWYRKKNSDQLVAMRALSSSSSWYFIEKAEIGSLRVTLSLSIASKVLAGSEGENKSLFNRSLNTSGLQLLDVDDAPLQISGLTFSEEVIGVNALKQRLQQHLQWQIISEAHKILGGSGPAIIAAPLSVVYACSSAFTIGQEITAGKLGPVVAAQQLGFVAFSAMSQAIGAFSKTLILILALVPTDEDHKEWADTETLRRYSSKAINAPRSLYCGFRELFTGTVRGLSGIFTDPVWACQKGGILLLPAGLIKGTLGVPIRPIAGFLECASKVSQGFALLCLGKEGIEGNIPHRVRAPDVFQEQAQLKSIAESEHEGNLEKWKDTLVKLAPEFQKDTLIHYLDLDPASSKKRNTLLFTKAHKIILIGCREKKQRLKFFLCWTLAGTAVKQVVGREEKFKVKLRHMVRFPTACCGEWSFPSTKIIQCATKDIFSRSMFLINVQRGSEASKPIVKELSIDKSVDMQLVPKNYYLS